ncbi:MAG TPA: glutamine-hydrolyzing carbamoyl-phosphate synthase small subunit [Polyangiaceae bacterium]|nr:glutamine-hydrolyzing carbamoyl-phosphate synthase small subunit [Polyangiaceae bacterium]
MSKRRAYLALADGTIFEGRAHGKDGSTTGEVVFTTGMTGYQEVLTDPSFFGQLVTMTSPQIGNTGINADDQESVDSKPQVAGFIIRDASPVVSNYRAIESLDEYLARNGVVAISDVDTRRLTRYLRDNGSQNGAIGTEDPATLVDRAKAAPNMEGLDLVARVTPKQAYEFTETRGAEWQSEMKDGHDAPASKRHDYRVVAIDYGAKRNILRCLHDSGCHVTAVPASTSAQDILAMNPDGIFLSSGPGDPAALPYAVKTVQELLGKKPIFGICLGHQLLARALGGTTYKLKFGHRGLNQPVKDLTTGRIEITTQNHGFVVDLQSLPGVAESTHVHLNDGSSEGLEAKGHKAFSVQYHPEAAAGPHDALYLFDRFRRLMDAR